MTAAERRPGAGRWMCDEGEEVAGCVSCVDGMGKAGRDQRQARGLQVPYDYAMGPALGARCRCACADKPSPANFVAACARLLSSSAHVAGLPSAPSTGGRYIPVLSVLRCLRLPLRPMPNIRSTTASAANNTLWTRPMCCTSEASTHARQRQKTGGVRDGRASLAYEVRLGADHCET